MTDWEQLHKHVGLLVAYLSSLFSSFIYDGLAADQDKWNTIYFVGRITWCHNIINELQVAPANHRLVNTFGRSMDIEHTRTRSAQDSTGDEQTSV